MQLSNLLSPLKSLLPRITIILCLTLTSQAALSTPPAFVCDGTPYPTFGKNPSTLQRIDKQTLEITNIAPVSPTGTLNATGYNILDDYIYGLKGQDFVQLAADGSYLILGKPTGIGSANGVNWNIGIAFAGTMDTSGNWYGHDKNYMYRVNIGQNPAAGSLTYERFSRSGSYTGTVADLSFNPLDGNLYGMSGGRLRKITPAGVGSTVTTSGAALSGNAGGAWSTSSGILYFYNNSKGLLFSVDMDQAIPVANFIGNVASNGTFDATACTPPVLSKSISTNYAAAGEQFTYDFKLTNPYTNPLVVEFTDNLTNDNITFVADSLSPTSPGSGTVTTFDADTLIISNLTIPAGLPPNNEVAFSVQAVANADITNMLSVPNQAKITYGSRTTVSDDPNSTPIDDPTLITIYASDWGDAPASYGDAKHVISTTRHFMGTAPDGDIQMQNTANGGSDGSGDDDEMSADEDGVRLNGTTLQNQVLNNGVPVTLAVATSGAARLHGWIDWDRDGVFGNHPNERVISETDNTSGPRSFVVTPPSGLSAGISYARFRYSTDIEAANPTGKASDGEIEDYQIELFRGFTVSGRVYQDTQVDGISNPDEPGVSAVTMVLYDTVNAVCVSTQTAANGDYVFRSVLSGSYQVYESAFETTPTPQNCGPGFAEDPAGYVSTTANVSSVFTIDDAAVSGIDFGDIKPPLFEIDNSKSILPNTSVVHQHSFTALSNGRVTFSMLSEIADPANVNWSFQLLTDQDCDGQSDSDDQVLPASLSVIAGQQVCLLVKVLAPANIASGALHVLEVQSDFTFGNDGSLVANDIQIRQDITRSVITTTDNAGGKPMLIKSVWNVTRGIDGSVVLPGEILRYTITYENIGNRSLNELIINDSVPASTQLVPGSLSCSNKPPELSPCATNSSPDGSLSWSWATADKLLPGSIGSVSYEVTVE